MLLTEWDTEEAKKVWYEDGWDDGRIEGRVEGQAEGQAEGREEREKEIARNLLKKGSTTEFIHEITGLDTKIIQGLSRE